MENERQLEQAKSITTSAVERLIESALESDPDNWQDILSKEELVTNLAVFARESNAEVQALALWGLGEIAKERSDAVGSTALDKLDQISKYGSNESQRALALTAIRTALKG